MITIENKEYTQKISAAIARSKQAIIYWRELIARYQISVNDFVLLLSSKDEEINYHTLRLLGVFRQQRSIRRFLILSPDEHMVSFVQKHIFVPYEFALCSQAESDELSRLYNIYKYTDQLAINSFHLSADKDMFRLADNTHLSKKDLVALAVLEMGEVPTEQEISDSANITDDLLLSVSECPWYYMDTPSLPDGQLLLDDIVAYALKPLMEQGQITQEDQLLLFGATKTARSAAKQLTNYHVVAYLDNSSDKIGTCIDGIPVLHPNQYSRQQESNVKILICSRKYWEIGRQLNSLGYSLSRQVFVIYAFPPFHDTTETAFQDLLDNRIHEGQKIYEKLRTDYPEEMLLIRPHPGTGDMYLLGGYIDQIVQDHPYILTVPSKSIKNAAELFNINTIICELDNAKKLLDFVRMIGFDELGVYSVNDNLNLPNSYQPVRIRTDLHTMFQRLVFGIDKKTTTFPYLQENSDHFFDTCQLMKGKTILLSPYAGTIDTFSITRWEQLASMLLQKGYSVCTNVSSPTETAIKGTLGIKIPYKQVIDFVNKAGGFIGLRNGLCDIVSSTPSRMAVLYPKNGLGTPNFYYSYFSLEHMELRHDKLLELVYEDDLTDDDQQKILRFITSEDEDEPTSGTKS